jgi:hypothetical protein
MEYTYTKVFYNEELVGILRNEDKAAIPLDPANADYQAYLNRDNPDWGKLTLRIEGAN